MTHQPRTRLPIALVAAILLGSAFTTCASTDPGRDEVSEVDKPRLADTQLVLQDLSGDALDLNAVLAEGRAVAFVFWQTWCGACIAEAPRVGEAARELAGQVLFVGVVPGPNERVDDAKVLTIAGETRMDFPQVRDRDLALTRAFEVTGTPTIAVLRPDGSAGYVGHGLPANLGELR